jgi:hypothetical protein
MSLMAPTRLSLKMTFILVPFLTMPGTRIPVVVYTLMLMAVSAPPSVRRPRPNGAMCWNMDVAK